MRPRYRVAFEAVGADGVRLKLQNLGYAGEELAAAQEWLAERDADAEREESRLRASISIEANRIARTEKNAAIVAAAAATAAAIVAIISMVVALITVHSPH